MRIMIVAEPQKDYEVCHPELVSGSEQMLKQVQHDQPACVGVNESQRHG